MSDTNGNPTVEGENSAEVVGGWVERQKYDYERYKEPARDPDAPRGQPRGEWAASGERYEWHDEYGDVAPRHEELEKILFGPPAEDTPEMSALGGSGAEFNKLLDIKVKIEGPVCPEPIATFADAGLHPVMLENIKLYGYEVPTPIQRYCVPTILNNYDLLACAQTGSGKTAAFLIPILSKLMGKAKKLAAPRPIAEMRGYVAEPLVLIVAPTRELATQIFDECRRFCYRSMLRPCVVYGGADSMTQRLELAKGCDVLIGTPGRLIDFLERGRIMSFRRVRYAVVDEADEMLDMGFEPQLRRILESSDVNQDDDRRCYMFSATFPKEVRKLASEFLSDDYLKIRVGRIGSTTSNVTQNIVFCDDFKKKEAVYDLLCTAPAARTLIFVGHKRTADALDDYLYNLRLPTTSIHSDRTQREREDALIAFRSGKSPIMIATGIASRGLDIKNVMHVINYDLPPGIDEYIHRIGRTARIGNHGLATSFYNERNEDIAADLCKILIENDQPVPYFLEQYRPEGELNWDEVESEEENDDEPASDDDGWGTGGGAANDGDGW